METMATLRVLILLLFSSHGYGLPALRLENSRAAVKFHAVSAPSAVRIPGQIGEGPFYSGALVLMDRRLTGTVQVSLDALETGISLRTQHLKEKFLQTAEHPSAELVLGSLTLPAGNPDFQMEEVPFEGSLKFHGSQKPVFGTASVRLRHPTLEFSAAFKIKLSDFGIDTPTFFGVKVAEWVEINADASGVLEELIP